MGEKTPYRKGHGTAGTTMTMTPPPGTAPAQNKSDHGQRNHGRRFGGSAVRFTAGGSVLAALAAMVAALTLPSAAPGWQPATYVTAAAAVAVLLTASLAGHELAHGLAARRHGVQVSEISIGFAGGRWHGRRDLPGPPAAPQVAVPGPVASFIPAAVSA